ncbi:MAG: maltose alpha-D-glucosyltransferase [Acidobacteria bacterium]|nr:maltose alpha-D-glucosyltransferase [Acidobacteriota bacterium]
MENDLTAQNQIKASGRAADPASGLADPGNLALLRRAGEQPAIIRIGSASDPLWYKDAIIYELPVKSFFDSNNDGIGDFPGLTQKLEYLQNLGVTCLWLLPFFPSPLRDDGYDISDYMSVHPDYGTVEDFQMFLDSAHRHELQVMIELVVNHTSDQHPWFQRARLAPPGSPEREFYVWSDTDQKYPEARIIFTDTEKSNWTWDPVAKAYFWHRFFSHQPDLNYDNPAVLEEVLKAMRFWLDLGVDGLRLDAIPYLAERDGTNCENLPETHVIVRRIRQEMDLHYANRMILAEANQWPSDVRPYFGDGDECHMAFHFPLMPRMFMALRLEDRLPITEIMAQTPAIPDNCQWGLFLRNHDELTLEMVSADERDYMYLAYSSDPRMRLNIGIRRRLAPLMDNNRRRIELLNSLLFSFPGTPILYYGDEIGMGDNIYLGDRNGVRTPMHWSVDRNAGFSRVNPAKLYSPVLMDPVYGYEAINVEAQRGDPSSLFNWMSNMIALRKLFRVFGRGSFEFLEPANRKVIAYLRRFENEQVLCVANLSRFAQPVQLDLSALEGVLPVEMLGCVEFPVIGRQPYPLVLGPYGFIWFELHEAERPEAIVSEPEGELSMMSGWEDILEGSGRQILERQVLPEYLPKQRWFGGKARRISEVSVTDWVEFESMHSALVVIEVQYERGTPESYFLPLAISWGDAAVQLREAAPKLMLCSLSSGSVPAVLYDAVASDSTRAAFLALIEEQRQIHSRKGLLRGVQGERFWQIRGAGTEVLASTCLTGEQSNSSIIYGDRAILKLFRRQESGPNPDCEVGRYLTEQAQFTSVPPFAGVIEYLRDGADPATLGMLQGLVENQGDAWTWTLDELHRYYEQCAAVPQAGPPYGRELSLLDLSEVPTPEEAREHVGIYLDSAAMLGRRTAELHLALAAETADPAFAPEPLGSEDLRRLETEMREHASVVLEFLKANLANLPDDLVEPAGLVLNRRKQLTERFAQLSKSAFSALRTRIHGDYHLGQLLRVKNDFVILDFEGEPARSLAERRSKQSPLKDVAGMLRSFSYAAWSALLAYTTRHPEKLITLEPWAKLWERATGAEFLRAYCERGADAAFLPAREGLRALLEAYLLDKTFYELRYELNNRPDWIRIPLNGILSM